MKSFSNVRFHAMALMLILVLPVLSACQGGQITIQVPGGGGDSGGDSTTSDDLFTTQFLFVIILVLIVFAAMVAVLR